MTTETFSIIALEETQYWYDGELPHGIEAAFGYYLIRHGEATHICSFTPNSWCYWIRNEFVYDSNNEAAHEWAGDNMHDHGDSDYFGYMEPDKMDPRFVAETFTIEMEQDLDSMERDDPAREEYHRELWKQAEEIAHEFDCNGIDARIVWTSHYREYQREKLAKRHAENRKPLDRDQLPLFAAYAQREGIATYEAARKAGLI